MITEVVECCALLGVAHHLVACDQVREGSVPGAGPPRGMSNKNGITLSMLHASPGTGCTLCSRNGFFSVWGFSHALDSSS